MKAATAEKIVQYFGLAVMGVYVCTWLQRKFEGSNCHSFARIKNGRSTER